MAEYIEREKLIAELNNIAIDLLKDNSIQCSLAAGTVVDIKDNVVAKQPAADVVEIVRRKLPLGKIQTALDHCKRPAGKHECDKCPYVSSRGMCTTNLLNDAISLISCLQSDNERLMALNSELSEKGEKVCIALKEESKKAASLQKFKEYFDGLYGCDLEVLGWHENGDAISFDEFYDSAMNEMESTKQKECRSCVHYLACKGTYYTAKGDNGLLHDFDGEMYADSGCEDYRKALGDKNDG